MARKNYTAREKEELKIIVEKYKDIIENKNINAQVIAKKVEAWDAVALEFNSIAEYPRTAKQLLGLYHNLKRSTRQDRANESMEMYLKPKEDDLLRKIKKDEANDKKELRATGGSSLTPALGAADTHMLAAMGPQIQPLHNDVDSASFYPVVKIEEVDMSVEHEHQFLSEDLHEESSALMEPSKEPSKLTETVTKNDPRKIISSKAKKKEILKTKFYLKKLQTAEIEKKEALVKLRIAQRQERLLDMELKIKEQQLKNLQNKVI